MRRRDFLGVLGCGVATIGLPCANAQQPGKVYRVGYLSGGTAASRVPLVASLKQGLRDLGYIEGTSLFFEARYAEGKFENLPALAQELLGYNLDVLLASTTPGALAAKNATSSVPIVIVGVADPIGSGLVQSLARPGGNITGTSNIGAELAGKRLQILAELIPSASRIAVMVNTDDPNWRAQMDSASEAAKNLGIKLDPVVPVRSPAELTSAVETAAAAKVDGAIRMIDPLVAGLAARTVKLAHEHRLPIVHPFREAVAAGGLISYGTNQPAYYQQTAMFVHRILNGARPADLPLELPTKFELAINLKAAKELALSVPTSILLRADEVIE